MNGRRPGGSTGLTKAAIVPGRGRLKKIHDPSPALGHEVRHRPGVDAGAGPAMPEAAFIVAARDAKGRPVPSAEGGMDETRQPTVSGIEIAPVNQETAETLARAVRELAATLPFGTEPLDFLSALEAEAVEQKA
jgi:hypothetical protein